MRFSWPASVSAAIISLFALAMAIASDGRTGRSLAVAGAAAAAWVCGWTWPLRSTD
jgi:hypothetical protein